MDRPYNQALLTLGIGVIWLLVPNLPWLGWLPGDIVFERGNTKVYFPIATCLLLSALKTVVMWLVRRFSN